MSANTTEGGNQFANLGLTGGIGSELTNLLLADAIVPGSPVGYATAKAIFAFHPLGAKMAENPINMAQSQEREITVPAGPETRLVEAFHREWKAISADALIKSAAVTARIYGIASLVAGERGGDPSKPIDWKRLADADLYFNVLDPLNTAGSLVLDQDPNSPDFQKPKAVSVGNQAYHPSRTVVAMNEQPIYIEWSNSAFGFVGRSVYQRALYPMKSFINSMITDDTVTKKVGLLVWMAKAPGSIINNRMMSFLGWKRSQLQSGLTGNVLTIPETDKIESLNFQNLEGAARLTRENILKNIATAAGMPARMLDQETLVSGFGEGAEDAKQIARYIDRVRIEIDPLYRFFDRIVQRRAWSPAFYETIKRDYPDDVRGMPYETAFYQWVNSFKATWPNLLVEPDSERAKTEEVRFKSAVAVFEVMMDRLDPENAAALAAWVADEINSRRELFSVPLPLDEDALAKWLKSKPAVGADDEMEPRPFSAET
jgi:hypothetical protein